MFPIAHTSVREIGGGGGEKEKGNGGLGEVSASKVLNFFSRFILVVDPPNLHFHTHSASAM